MNKFHSQILSTVLGVSLMVWEWDCDSHFADLDAVSISDPKNKHYFRTEIFAASAWVYIYYSPV